MIHPQCLALQQVRLHMDMAHGSTLLAFGRSPSLALQSNDQWFDTLNKTYNDRRQLVWQLAEELGGHFQKDNAGMFVWLKLPEGTQSIEFSERILHDYHIFTTPGDIFGSQGKGYLRLSLCLEAARIKEAIHRIKHKLKHDS